MEWHEFADWAMKAILGCIFTYGVQVMSGLKKSIDQLNDKMAIIIERTKWHSREIDRLDDRITRFEAIGRANG